MKFNLFGLSNTFSINTGVYQIKNLKTGKVYIGSAASQFGFAKRWDIHKSNLRLHKHCNQYLQRAWNKYGVSCFVFEILELCEPEQCIGREQYYLDTCLFANYNDERFYKLGYNICRVAGNTYRINIGDRCIDIARDFDVSRQTISHIKHGRKWKYVCT